MRRFYLPPDALNAVEAVISGPDANHIKNVLRLKPGDPIVVFDGLGHARKAAIAAISSDRVAVALGPELAAESVPSVEITLAQALLKSGKMDILLRQATELGISRWAPFVAERSVPDLDKRRAEKKRARWETIAREAMKQCRQNRMPAIMGVSTFDGILKIADNSDLSLFFYEGETSRTDPLTLSKKIPPPARILIILGPEGGFAPAEIARAKASNTHFISLGPRILRAETAALAACTLAQFIFGDMREKPLDKVNPIG